MVLAVILSIVGISLLITSEINVQEAITVELYPVNYKGYLYVELNKLQPFIDSEIFTKLLAEHKFSIIYENVYYEIQTTELVDS